MTDNTTSMALLTKMQRAHQAVEDLAEEGHRIAIEHDHALSHCRDELQRIDVACKTVIGDSAGSTYDAVVCVLDKLAEAQAVIAHIEQERARAEQAEDQVRQSLKVAVEENAKLREMHHKMRNNFDEEVARALEKQEALWKQTVVSPAWATPDVLARLAERDRLLAEAAEAKTTVHEKDEAVMHLSNCVTALASAHTDGIGRAILGEAAAFLGRKL